MPFDQLYSLPLEQQIGQFFFIGLPGPELDEVARALIDEIKPGGIILFGRNVQGADQVRKLLDGARAMLPVTPLLAAIDQEGGLVDRLRDDFHPNAFGACNSPARRPGGSANAGPDHR